MYYNMNIDVFCVHKLGFFMPGHNYIVARTSSVTNMLKR